MDGIESYRYERKFLVRDLSLEELNQVVDLHPAAFYPIHSPRWINNIYLDSPGLRSFTDNVEGFGTRIKFRIRWYGDMVGNIQSPILEIKKKWGYLSQKELIPVPDFNFEELLTTGRVMELLQNLSVRDEIWGELIHLQPALLNRYHRSYFLSADQKFRVTLDSHLEFYPAYLPLPQLLEHKVQENSCILELKYDPEQDDQAKAISNEFQFRLTKSSKYVSGIYHVFPG